MKKWKFLLQPLKQVTSDLIQSFSLLTLNKSSPKIKAERPLPNKKSPISELPEEMLAHIFSSFPLVLNFQLRFVSRRFNETWKYVTTCQIRALVQKYGMTLEEDQWNIKIWQQQKTEFDYLLKRTAAALKYSKKNPDAMAQYQGLQCWAQINGLQGLFLRDEYLDSLNRALIMQRIQISKQNWGIDKTLDCRDCYLTRFPRRTLEDETLNSFWTELTHLVLAENFLTSLPENLFSLPNLIELDIGSNRFTLVPENISRLTTLQNLDVSNNCLTTLKESMGNLVSLTTLDVSNNLLIALPKSLGQLTKLKELSICKNKLQNLQDISRLSALRRLYASDNLITTLPEELGQLPALEKLSLEYNCLSDLSKVPDEILIISQQYDKKPGLGIKAQVLALQSHKPKNQNTSSPRKRSLTK